MQFDSVSAFIDMGGYGFFVWLSYGVSAVLLIGLFINSLYGHKKIIQQIIQRQKREQKLRQAAEQQNTLQDSTAQNNNNSAKENS